MTTVRDLIKDWQCKDVVDETRCGTAWPMGGPCTFMRSEIALPCKVCIKLLEIAPV